MILTVSYAQKQLNIYNAISRAGYTPGLAFLVSGDTYGLELGVNYALGASTANVEYESFAANLLLTYKLVTGDDNYLLLKAGGSYREVTTSFTSFSTTIVDKEILYYNWGIDYMFEIKELGTLGFSYFADNFGLVYVVKF